MKQYLLQLLKDKDGNYSLREFVIILFVICTVIGWLADQFFGVEMPEYMFYAFISLIAAGCFGYSFETRTKNLSELKGSPGKENLAERQ